MAHLHSWTLRKAASVLDVHRGKDANAEASLLQPLGIVVKDPPRDQLPAGPAEDSAFLLARFSGHPSDIHLYTPLRSHAHTQKSPRRRRVRMAKNRRSLQSLFIPSFLTAPLSPTTDLFSPVRDATRSRSNSQSKDDSPLNYPEPSNVTTRDDSPPGFLLDDDPFANLSAAPARVYPTPSSPTPAIETPPPTPRSPLTPAKPSFLSSPPPITPLSPPGVSRTRSGMARPAYSKPAFAPRPSLPSLDTLARINVVLPKKVRKGKVGAGLPFEPWDQPYASGSSGESSSSSIESLVESSSPTAPAEFVTELEIQGVSEGTDDTLTSNNTPATLNLVTQERLTSPVLYDDFSYSGDSDNSLDSLDDDEYITSSELSYLSSTSLTSSSSIGTSSTGSPEFLWPSFSRQNSMSSADESDILSSPPDDFDFKGSRFDSHNIISSYWSSEDLYDSLNGDVSASTLYPDLVNDSDMNYEPGTSAGTIRPSTSSKHRDRSSSPPFDGDNDEMVDGSGRENANYEGKSYGRGWEQSSGTNVRRVNGNRMGGDGRASDSRTNRFGGRGDDEDEDDERRRLNRSTFSTPSDSEGSTSDADEDSTDDYGEAAPAEVTSSDDDVPLAQRIPSALKAQSTIRKQVREERNRRRAARAAAAESSSTPRGVPFRPPGAAEPMAIAPLSSTQEAALHASRSLRRPPTRTLPAPDMQPFSPDDLAKRLQTMEVAEPSTSTHRRSKSTRRDPTEPSGSASRPGSAGHGLRDPGTSPSPLLASPAIGSPPDHRPLRPSRSFHRPESRRAPEEYHVVPMPVDAGRRLARSITRKEEGSSPRSYPTRVLDESSSKPLSRRSGEEPRRLVKYPETRSTRSSSEHERPRRSSLTRPPVPPLPAEALAGPSSPPNLRGPVTQQRVFIGDMQRFNMVEIGPSTNANDVIEMVEAQGSLKGWVGSGDWMVWEIAQDFGMERPIRSFELLSDVQASWNKDKLMNTFVIKLTPLAVPLSRSAMPSVSPTYAGYVEWESKRGKWNKRWLQLREHSLWLSKRDNGRDEILLCSLSNFDAYFITRLHKAPRAFSFAVKSTDKLSFFENTADYLHIFSCGEKEGPAWVEHILLARSYVLFQERNVLFNPKAANGNAAGGPGTLSRSGTRKTSSAHRPVPPLVSGVAPPLTIAQQLQSNDVFEPGSLLRKHA